jgi:hypothetical protein
MSENMGASTSRKPKGLHGLYRDTFTFNFLFFRNVMNISENTQYVLHTVQESCYISDDDNKIVTSFWIQNTHRLRRAYIFTSASQLPITNGKQSGSWSNFIYWAVETGLHQAS